MSHSNNNKNNNKYHKYTEINKLKRENKVIKYYIEKILKSINKMSDEDKNKTNILVTKLTALDDSDIEYGYYVVDKLSIRLGYNIWILSHELDHYIEMNIFMNME